MTTTRTLWHRLTGRDDQATLLAKSARGRDVLAAMEADAVLERLEERSRLAGEIATLRAEEARLVADYNPRAAAANRVAEEARAAYDAAVAEAQQLSHAHRSAMLTQSQAIDRLERRLRDSSSPLIDAFIASLAVELEHTVAAADAIKERTVAGWFATVWSNAASVQHRIEALQAAGRAADALRVEALDDAELSARLEALLAAVPAVETRDAYVAQARRFA